MAELPLHPSLSFVHERGIIQQRLVDLQYHGRSLGTSPNFLDPDHRNYRAFETVLDAVTTKNIAPNDAFFIASMLMRKSRWANTTEIDFASGERMPYSSQPTLMWRSNLVIGNVMPGHKIYSVAGLGAKMGTFLKHLSPQLLDLYDNKMLILPEGELPDELTDLRSLQILPDREENQNFLKTMSQITWYEKQTRAGIAVTGRFYLTPSERIFLHTVYLSHARDFDQLAQSISHVFPGTTPGAAEAHISRLRSKIIKHPQLRLPAALDY